MIGAYFDLLNYLILDRFRQVIQREMKKYKQKKDVDLGSFKTCRIYIFSDTTNNPFHQHFSI